MKKLEPFKFFCLQNFPFIEEDFDALTNYELMCKIIEYLNKNIEKTNELGIQVQNLVNWFNNLDVQDEINNKLDDMAESGELERIIDLYMNESKHNIIIIGDSYAVGISNGTKIDSYAKILAETYLKSNKYKIIADGGAGFVRPR